MRDVTLSATVLDSGHTAAAPVTRSDAPQGLRIGFLFNHDDLHQAAHTAPVISALMREAPSLKIEVITSSEAQNRKVRSLLEPGTTEPVWKSAAPGRLSEILEALTGHMIPLRRMSSLKRHRSLFQEFDALVVPESTSLMLKTRFGVTGPRFICLPHGAGDRAIGFEDYKRHFDFMLLAGEKIRERLIESGVRSSSNCAIIGYPKFDTVNFENKQSFFDNDAPVVLYNPHFDAHLSSWYAWGERILDWFACQKKFNLIFAPHVMLFRRTLHVSLGQRRIRWRKRLSEKYSSAPNILIDTGSENSINMSYTLAADIYLGDISSQIYEFLCNPRPCIFLNAHSAQWRSNPNYRHWTLGPVVERLSSLPAILDSITDIQENYLHLQKQAFTHTYSLEPNRTSAERAASAIVNYLGNSDG